MRLLVMMAVFFGGCLSLHAERNRGKELCQEVAKLDSQVASRLNQKWGLSVCSYGGHFGQGIQSIDPGFVLNRIVKVDEARKILLDAIQEYEMTINQDISMRPYLLEYPFDLKRLTLSIRFRSMPMSQYGTEYVSYALFLNGKLSYSAQDDTGEFNKYTDVKPDESYEEALKINAGGDHD
jgi:hypothetical protein